MSEARSESFRILLRMELGDAWASPLLKGARLSNENETEFCAFLVKTAQEHLLTIDYNVSLYLKKPLKALEPKVIVILRLGAAQLLYAGGVPVSAAVNESVRLAKKNGCGWAAGIINAVLRRVAENGLRLPDESAPDHVSVKYSLGQGALRAFSYSFDEKTLCEVLDCFNDGDPPVIYIRKNTLRDEELTLDCSPTGLDGCFILKDRHFAASEDHRKGLFHVQDLSSQMACRVLDPKPGTVVADVCAAPGGKTATIAQLMDDSGEIIACDVHEHRLKLIKDNLSRLGISSVKVMKRDAAEGNLPMCDSILCDVPCSGLGVIRRKPEIRYKSADDIAGLPGVQLKILTNSARYLKPGGRLVYSTCTLNKKENGDVVREFLKNSPDFSLVPFTDPVDGSTTGGMLTVLPSMHNSDGFFIACLRKS